MGKNKERQKGGKNGKKWIRPFAFFCFYFVFSICFVFAFILFYFRCLRGKKSEKNMQMDNSIFFTFFSLFVFPFFSFFFFWLLFF